MIEYKIMRGTEVVFTSKNFTGTVINKIMAEHYVSLNLTSPTYIDFRIGDTVTVYNVLYTLRELPNVTKNSSLEYIIPLIFRAEHYALSDVQFFGLDASNEYTVDTFPLTFTPEQFVDHIIANANRVKSGWVKGKVLERESLMIDFSRTNCKEALTMVANAFETEWHVEGKTIHLYRRGDDLTVDPEFDSGWVFEYGKGKGLSSIQRNNIDDVLFTRLYARGSEKNLPGDYRGYNPNLLLPVADGPYLSKNEDLYGIKEHTELFDQIFPTRTGIVTSVNGLLKFSDAGMDFDINEYLVPGISVKINFLTGQLAGITFELVEKIGYDNDLKEFYLLKNENDKGIILPNEDLKPQVGDLYNITDIIMPPTYVQAAEDKLKVVADFFLDLYSKPRVQYPVNPDEFYIKQHMTLPPPLTRLPTLRLCDNVTIIADEFGLNKKIRIVSIERDINNRFKYKFTVSETVKLISAVLRELRQKEIDRILKTPIPSKPIATAWRGVESSGFCVLNGGFKTGYFAYSQIEEYVIGTNTLTGKSKPNIVNEPDYVSPVYDVDECPLPTFQDIDISNSSTYSVNVIINNSDEYSFTFVSQVGINTAIIQGTYPVSVSSQGGFIRVNINGEIKEGGSLVFENIPTPMNILITNLQ